MLWSVYRVERRCGLKYLTGLGYVHGARHPAAVLRAKKRWPQHVDETQPAFGFHVRLYRDDPMGLGRKACEARRREPKRYAANGLAGCVEQRRVRQTGTLVGVYHAEQAGLDPTAGAWATSCEAHGSILAHASLNLARSHAADPCGWCEQCREEHPS